MVLNDGTQKFAAVLPTPNGPRVDWASFVALGDLDWEQMREVRPLRPVLMRVQAQRASHYTGPFRDQAKLLSVRLVSAADADAAPVFGYVPLDTDLGKQLGEWLGADAAAWVPLTVKVCYPEGTISPDQVWITEVVVPGWVTVAANTPR